MAKGDCLDVVFRVFSEGEIIALFPGVEEGGGTIMAYQHVGQHSAASSTLTRELRAATPTEYAPLLAELKNIGYCVRVMKRAQISRSGRSHAKYGTAAQLLDRLRSTRQAAFDASRLKSRAAKKHGLSADYWAKSAEKNVKAKRYDAAHEDLERAETYVGRAARAAGFR